MPTRNILNVFIASPSDLNAERRVAREIVTEVNDMLRSTNWSIELLGWEDTLPGYGRPQARINRDVDRCDLFIGLLWRRWGTPPTATGTFSSGFEEEFSVAQERRERTSSPEIWVFFKEVEQDQTSDAGAQLTKVIAFHQSLVNDRTVLFRKFVSTEEWAKKLREYLMRHVLENVRPNDNVPHQPSETATASLVGPGKELIVSSAPAAAKQIASLVSSLDPFLETGDLNRVRLTEDNQHDTAFLAIRLLLFSLTLVHVSGSSASLIPTHESNSLYKYREGLQASDEELLVILRTVLADQDDVTPGWYWFRNWPQDDLLNLMLWIALGDGEAKARATSLRLLRGNRTQGTSQFRKLIARRAAPEVAADLQDDVWIYLVDTATAEDIAALRKNPKASWLDRRIDWLDAWIASGRDLDRFLRQCPDARPMPNTMARSIKSNVSQISDDSLQSLMSMNRPDLKTVARNELRTRGIAVEESSPEQDNISGPWSLTGLGGLEKQSETTGNCEEDGRYAAISQDSSEHLMTIWPYYSIDGPIIYRVLAERGRIPRGTVRNDISTGFSRVRQQSIERMKEEIGLDAAVKAHDDFDAYREFIVQRYTEQAFRFLQSQPTREDAVLARQFLSDDRIRRSTVRIVGVAGDETDLDRLIDIAGSTFGEERESALAGIRSLSTNKFSTSQSLLGSDNRKLRKTGLSLIADLSDSEAVPLLEALLSDADEEIRLEVVAQLYHRIDRQTLENVLSRYVTRDTYYYNVVTWLDRLIYAAPPLLKRFEEELEAKVQNWK
jgi:hypothetical protein